MIKNTIVIVDDHTLLSQAISGVVSTFEDFDVLYTCKNGAELVEKFKIKRNIPNIVLMDVNMPIMNGFETTEWLKSNHSQVKVIALSVEEDEHTILKMLRAGARGYMLKDTDKTTLEMALIKVVDTGFYHSNSISEILMNSFNGNTAPDIILKEREIELIKLICTELTYKEIADIMKVSAKTIDGYRETLFVKLNVKNRIGLVLYAIKNKIFVP
jgi:DNA-binding NarL/FixJ family response regulator